MEVYIYLSDLGLKDMAAVVVVTGPRVERFGRRK